MVKNEKELADAIKSKKDVIVIKGDLSKKVIKIKATGKVAWVIAFGAIAVAIVAILATASSGGTIGPVTIPTATLFAGEAIAIWGLPTTIAAISLCVAAKSKNALKSLYDDYKIIEQKDNYVKIRRK